MKTQHIALALFLIFAFSGLAAQKENPALRGNSFFENQQYAKAIELFDQALAQQHEKQVLLKRAKACYFEQQWQKSANDFKQLQYDFPAQASLFLARIYALSGESPNALQWLEKHLSSDQKVRAGKIKTDSAFAALKNTPLWNELWKKDWYSETEQKYHHAAYLLSQKKPEQALDALDLLLDEQPGFHEAAFLRAQIYFQSQDYKAALYNLDLCLEKQSRNPEYLELAADARLALGKHRKALKDYEKALKYDKLNLEIRYKIAQVLFEKQDYDEALDQLENNYLPYAAEPTQAFWLCGEIHFANGNWMQALRCFNQCLKNDTSKAKYFVSRGNAYLKTNMFRYAHNDFSMALDLTPYNGYIYFQRGKARLKMGNKQGACIDWKMAVHYGYKQAQELFNQHCGQ